MDYNKLANERISILDIPKSPSERLGEPAKNLLKKDYVIDTHVHLFDIKCINKAYFILRFMKDFLGLKSGDSSPLEFSEDKTYQEISKYNDNWEDDLLKDFENEDIRFVDKEDQKKGFIDIIKAAKFLSFKRMVDVYDHYITKFSLAVHFNLPKENVLVTALMMDLETGWGVKIKKSLKEQIEELKELSVQKPVLPFLFCDPRRADLEDDKENLYSLFNYAFCTDKPFFGVKIYPALGYDPSDYRLWPIYEICQKYDIPVLTHCGGESISTDQLELSVFSGNEKVILKAKKRKEMAYTLNDPKRWGIVLKKFPDLRLNFGHFGGYETWSSSAPVSIDDDPQQRKECIFNYMNTYKNVYADFSFNLVEVDLSKNLKNLIYFKENIRERTLFGTDYWVVNKEGNLHKEQARFLKIMDDGTEELKLSKALSIDNPKKYLF